MQSLNKSDRSPFLRAINESMYSHPGHWTIGVYLVLIIVGCGTFFG